MSFPMVFFNCNLDSRQEIYGLKHTRISVALEFPKPREIPVTREFPRLKLFPPVSRETRISQEFHAHGFPLNIPGTRCHGKLVAGCQGRNSRCYCRGWFCRHHPHFLVVSYIIRDYGCCLRLQHLVIAFTAPS